MVKTLMQGQGLNKLKKTEPIWTVICKGPLKKLLAIFLLYSGTANAIYDKTQSDLLVAEDQLHYEIQKHPQVLQDWFPALVSAPEVFWQKSQSDFGDAVQRMLRNLFPDNNNLLLPCYDCRQNRSFVTHDGQLVIQNGELSLLDLTQLRKQPAYSSAKTIIAIKETASGVETKIISLSDGKILFAKLADSSQGLEQAKPPLNLARELERRKNGEALNYVFIDLGFYPAALLHFEFLEQWGNRNQHLSGIVLSMLEPTAAIGASYHYLWPSNRKLNLGLSLLMPLTSSISSSSDSKSSNNFVGQGMLQYAISGNYAGFVTLNSKGVFVLGISFLNPVLFPFLL